MGNGISIIWTYYHEILIFKKIIKNIFVQFFIINNNIISICKLINNNSLTILSEADNFSVYFEKIIKNMLIIDPKDRFSSK